MDYDAEVVVGLAGLLPNDDAADTADRAAASAAGDSADASVDRNTADPRAGTEAEEAADFAPRDIGTTGGEI